MSKSPGKQRLTARRIPLRARLHPGQRAEASLALCRLKKLLEINRRTGIETRPAVQRYETASDFGCQARPPTIQDLDRFFREHGVALAAQACRKALREWGGHASEITHTVAVTCTNQGSPGYDLGVNHELGLAPDVERTLLHGVGCAGGLAIMRTAAQIATSAAARGEP